MVQERVPKVFWRMWTKRLLHWCKRLLAEHFSNWPKHLLHPLLTTLGNVEVSGLCSRYSGSQAILGEGDAKKQKTIKKSAFTEREQGIQFMKGFSKYFY